MGADYSVPRRNGAPEELWAHATSSATVAAKTKLEEQASLATKLDMELQAKRQQQPEEVQELQERAQAADVVVGFKAKLRRLAYSSVLNAGSREQANSLLSAILAQALRNNPKERICGILFYDEETRVLVQVLEGPSFAVRSLYYQRILRDTRHTAVRRLWDVDISERRYEGFGMKLGNHDPAIDVPQLAQQPPAHPLNGDADHSLQRLTYTSQLNAAHLNIAYRLVADVLRKAVVNNPQQGIGGVLFLNPLTLRVLQVLEGPGQAVAALYEKISRDLRHRDCIVLSHVYATERVYKEWGMVQGELEDWSELASGDWIRPPSLGEAGDGTTISADVEDISVHSDATFRIDTPPEPNGAPLPPGKQRSARAKFRLLGRFNSAAAPPGSAPAQKARLVVGPDGPTVRWSESVTSFPERTPERSRVNRLWSAGDRNDCKPQ